MRKIIIDFTKDPVGISNHILGKQGEHNATELIITPPSEMSANEKIKSYSVAFQIGAGKKTYSPIVDKAETITVLVERKATQVNYLSIQLEAYDGKENLLVKSERLDGFILEPSVVGDEQEAHISSGLIEQVTANTLFRNKFSENENGNLLYNGKPIERPFATIKCETILFATQVEKTWVLGVYDELPVKGVEIKAVRIRSSTYGDVDLRFMSDVPNQLSNIAYTLNFCTLNHDDYTGFASTVAMVEFATSNPNSIVMAISNYDTSYFEIDYYID